MSEPAPASVPAAVPAAGIHRTYLTTLLDELERRGIAATRLLPDGPPAEITPQALADLVRRAVTLTDDPAFALHYGLRLNLASHGILGYALMSCRNGDQLLSLLVRYARLAVPHIELARALQGDRVLLTCRTLADLGSPTLFVELVIATLVAAARSLFPGPIPGAEAWFDYAPPAHAADFAQLRLPVRFQQRHSALVCHRRFLDMEIGSADPALAELCARQCEALLATMRETVGVRETVRRALLNAAGEFPGLPELARRLAISERTLRRRLRAEQTSFRAITDEVRETLACRYLSTTTLPVTDIAALVGYDDPANFRRAFRRWTGVSPARYRAGNAA
ncbi:MAG: AraC family transcriptional regulator ligand-binding domain-containing protein [Pseudomonadales bacterium]